MRTLFFWVYLLIVGGFVSAFYLMEYLADDLYEQDFANGYRDYVVRISPLIATDLHELDVSDTEKQQTILSHWQLIIGEELKSLRFIAVPKQADFTAGNVIVTKLDTTDLTDQITLLARLADFHHNNQVLEFHFVDTVSEAYESWYLKGIIAVYLFMALLIGLLVLFLSNFLQRIKSLTNSVIAGELYTRMPLNSVPVFRTLSENLNHMVEELETKRQESDIFLGAIHHELRSPITKLRLALDMALDCNDEALLKELLTDMDIDLEELSALMEDILMLSRLRLQGQEPELTRVDISHLLKTIVSVFNDSKITLSTHKSQLICSNQILLERAFSNIIGNALKFAKTAVHIETRQVQDKFQILVCDDGPGIHKTERKIIFQPFYRTDPGRTRNTGGVGLGLAIAHLVITKMSGDIYIEDSPLGGAQFILELPLNENHDIS